MKRRSRLQSDLDVKAVALQTSPELSKVLLATKDEVGL
jgi:hypothetical protein